MAILDIPPWLNVQPGFFTQAIEAGARAGLGVAELNRRADEFAAAQVERNARAQERAAEEAERSRQFEETRLLNVQKIAQDAAQLQQQTAHQTAQESNQAAQESRLLQQFGLDKEIAGKAGFVEGRAGMYPPHILDARGNPSFFPENAMGEDGPIATRTEIAYDPETKKRMGVFALRGNKSWQFIPDTVEKGLTAANQISLFNAIQRGIISDLNTKQAELALMNPSHPQHKHYLEQQDKLRSLSEQLQGLNKKTPTVISPTNAVPAVTSPSGINTNAVPTTFPMTNAPTVLPATNAPTAGEVVTHSPLLVKTKAERDKLPKGTRYIGPDGKTYTKQ